MTVSVPLKIPVRNTMSLSKPIHKQITPVLIRRDTTS